jgi:hypothetical protein
LFIALRQWGVVLRQRGVFLGRGDKTMAAEVSVAAVMERFYAAGAA